MDVVRRASRGYRWCDAAEHDPRRVRHARYFRAPEQGHAVRRWLRANRRDVVVEVESESKERVVGGRNWSRVIGSFVGSESAEPRASRRDTDTARCSDHSTSSTRFAVHNAAMSVSRGHTECCFNELNERR